MEFLLYVTLPYLPSSLLEFPKKAQLVNLLLLYRYQYLEAVPWRIPIWRELNVTFAAISSNSCRFHFDYYFEMPSTPCRTKKKKKNLEHRRDDIDRSSLLWLGPRSGGTSWDWSPFSSTALITSHCGGPAISRQVCAIQRAVYACSTSGDRFNRNNQRSGFLGRTPSWPV